MQPSQRQTFYPGWAPHPGTLPSSPDMGQRVMHAPMPMEPQSVTAAGLSNLAPRNRAQPEAPKEDNGDSRFSKEVQMIHRIYKEKPEAMISLFVGQLSFLKTESQTILGLCGLGITVTGFSGGNVISAGTTSSGFLVAGICLLIIAGGIALYSLSSVHWITELLEDDLRVVAKEVTMRRDHFRRWLVVSSCALGAGLICYLTAVSIAALARAEQLREPFPVKL